jgi:hypothetical protein
MGWAAFRVVRNLESMFEYQISNSLPGIGECLAVEGEHGYKKEKLEPVVRQSDQSAVVGVLGNMSMAVCLSFFVFEMGRSDQYEFSDCTSFVRFFV